MTHDVLVRISGAQNFSGIELEQIEPVEVMTVGKYAFRDGKHYVKYDESYEDSPQVTHNTLCISDKSVSVLKNGDYSVEMIFEKDRTTVSYYEMESGRIEMDVATTALSVNIAESMISTNVSYSLAMNGEHMADCHVSMLITDKKTS